MGDLASFDREDRWRMSQRTETMRAQLRPSVGVAIFVCYAVLFTLAFLASGAYPWQRLVTHRVRLEDVPALLADPPQDYMKAAVIP